MCVKLGYRAKRLTTFATVCDDADCKLFTRITGNTQHLLYPLPLIVSITTLSLFVNAVTSFNYLIAHPFSKTKKLYHDSVVQWLRALITIIILTFVVRCVTAFCCLLQLMWLVGWSACVSVLLLLLLLLFIRSRRKPELLIYEPDQDVRENLGYYDEEGAGTVVSWISK